MQIEARMAELGLVIPEPLKLPPGVELPFPWVRVHGNYAYISGHGPQLADGTLAGPFGKVGAEVSVDEAYQRARLIGLQLLSATRMALGSLDRVETVLKMLVMVNAVPDFKDHPKVANGMSDVFVEVLGDAGKHARSAVGMGSLPNQISVEIEGVIAIKP